MTRIVLDHLEDMLSYGRQAIEFLEVRSVEELVADRKTLRAIERCIEVIGEATKRMPIELRQRFSALPWKDMAGMRDRVVHDYGNLNVKLIRETVIDRLPPLLAQLEEIVTVLRREAGEIP